jgi:hypothetical protein
LQEIEKITNPLNENKRELIQAIFEFEKGEYEIFNKQSSTFTDQKSFNSFHKAKKHLTEKTKEEVLVSKYVLAGSLEILILLYNTPELTSQEHWIDQLYPFKQNYQTGEYVFLLIKDQGNDIKYNKLAGNDLLLYYFSDEPISGNELIEVLMENQANTLSMEEYQDLIFDFISTHLLYTNYHCCLIKIKKSSLKYLKFS